MTELHQVLRAMRHSPGYVAIATLLLGLGLGANATLFTLINTMLFKPLGGIHQAESLVLIGQTRKHHRFGPMSYPHFEDYRERGTAHADIAAYRVMRSSLVRGDESMVVVSEMVSGNFFSVLRTKAAEGRLFRESDNRPGVAELTAVISESLWERVWNRSPNAVGATVVINGHPFTIIGVAGEGFRGPVLPTEVELWIPFAFEPIFRPQEGMLTNRDFSWVQAIGRLREGVSLVAAQASLSAITAGFSEEYPDTEADLGIHVWDYHPFPNPQGFRAAAQFLLILTGVTILVLIVVCANLSNLMLARARSRYREIAIRTALGASRWRVLRLLLLEGSVLAAFGLVFSLLIASWTATLVLQMIPGDGNVPLNLRAEPDFTVAIAAALLALSCTLLFAALPAWLGSGVALVPGLKAGDIAATPPRSRMRTATLVVQVALCFVMLVAAGLLLRSVQDLRAIDPGFEVDRLLLADLNVGLNGYDDQRALRFYRQLQERLATVSGVQRAALGAVVPLGGGGLQLGGVFGGVVDESKAIVLNCNSVSAGYFSTLGIPLVEGQDFQLADTDGARPTVIINETLAQTFWPGETAVGKVLWRAGQEPVGYEVVAVAKDIQYLGLRFTNMPFVYWPMAQQIELAQTIHIRTAGEPFAVLGQVRSLLRELDPHLAIGHVDTMERHVENSIWIQRLAGSVVTLCGMLGVLIAALGIYGVLSFEVARQAREIGVRMALGADTGDVVRKIVFRGLRVTGAGVIVGVLLSGSLSVVLESLLFGVKPWDLLSYSLSALILLVATCAACLVPALRATRIQPMSALRLD